MGLPALRFGNTQIGQRTVFAAGLAGGAQGGAQIHHALRVAGHGLLQVKQGQQVVGQGP